MSAKMLITIPPTILILRANPIELSLLFEKSEKTEQQH